MSDRRAYLCSSQFDPVLIKFNPQARLMVAWAGLCRSLAARQLIDARAAADVLRQHLTLKRWILTEVGTGADDLHVVEDVVALLMSFPFWAECLEFHHVFQVVFVSCCITDYETRFADESYTALDTQDLKSVLHFVRWF